MDQTLTVSNDWVNQDFSGINLQGNNVDLSSTTSKIAYCVQTYPNYFDYWHYSWAPKIQLKLSEIAKLQKIAKADPSIKEILNKFTAHIEVLVDF